MKILHTVAPADFGGLESVVSALACGLRDRGHDVRLFCVIDSEASAVGFRERVASRGVKVIPFESQGRGYLREIGEIRRTCESLRPDLVHMHGYRPCVLHRVGVNRARIPTVATLHGFTGGGLKNRIYEFAQVRAVRSFDAVVAVSRPLGDRLARSGVQPGRLRVIQNAWAVQAPPMPRGEARRILGVEPGDFHIGWIGRLSAEKGPDVFVDALRECGHSDRTTVSIIGDGPQRGALEASSNRLRTPTVRFHGALPEAARLMTAFDVLVLSSRTEGTPMVLLEGMAVGVPVVATAVGGVPDVVDDRTAILVPSEDIGALSAGIERVRNDPGAARVRAEAAKADLRDRFSIGSWLDAYERLYEEVVGR